ncbi:uncharacterized protein LAJ45_00275 [Morchella importuna]|uniref:Uncharacterized protein n=1 Tax=Morchella conica CCBAS932 TaxID=1392247 RepID=A0A3N4KQK0_9PEZI|nr:uncharacterized protein LAJ45_00275 [Morchella importuna]KAH8155266.1 hypothetical protein LAJ45_00275 [Morchella importuna]RPB11758.1 hypothetical protein P167DRAFT_574955 [Morchella conica CCBAS932]
MDYKRLSRCGVDNCKQTLFYLDDGQWFCKNGHLREGELEIEAEDEGFGPQGDRAARKNQEKEKVQRVLRGRRGFELFLQCYQLILQKQVHWLINKKGFPVELEIMVRDLWALQLKNTSATIPGISDAAPSQEDGPDIEGSINGWSSTTGWSSQSEYLYTSDEESQASTNITLNTRNKNRRRRKIPKASDSPRLIASVGLCYLGLMLLRVVVSLGDMHRWIGEEKLIYLRAIDHIPAEMRSRLDLHYIYSLDPKSKPKQGLLYHTVQELVVMYQTSFGMSFPPIDTTLMVFRYIKDLGFPLEVYLAVKRLSDLMSLTFVWNGLLPAKRVSAWPEAQLMALIIIATKLLYGLDGISRTPESSTEPAAVGLKWEAWDRFLRLGNAERRGLLGGVDGECSKKRLEVDVKEIDILDMNGEELDKYMDWFEKTWTNNSNTKLTEQILNLFPIEHEGTAMSQDTTQADSEKGSNASSDGLRKLNSQIELQPVAQQEEKTERPGDQYLCYSSTSELPLEHQTLLQAAADLLAITRDDLGKVVRYSEERFRNHLKEQRKKEMRESRM